jgi:hypothetical protein
VHATYRSRSTSVRLPSTASTGTRSGTSSGTTHGTGFGGPPKTDAGRRTIAIPAAVVDDLRRHLHQYAQAGSDGYVFTGEKGGPLAPHVLQKEWARAREAVGVEHLHLHDLRHLAGTLAATTGAGTKALMYRLGHASPQAALRYQHATKARAGCRRCALTFGTLRCDHRGAALVTTLRRSVALPVVRPVEVRSRRRSRCAAKEPGASRNGGQGWPATVRLDSQAPLGTMASPVLRARRSAGQGTVHVRDEG